ncbi:MAG: hypothetical protein L6V93_15360 [Clostridiales bacterium]|nr:MAG: hypothetical protein L6V93_15360 [Clostridiales bacterium]
MLDGVDAKFGKYIAKSDFYKKIIFNMFEAKKRLKLTKSAKTRSDFFIYRRRRDFKALSKH